MATQSNQVPEFAKASGGTYIPPDERFEILTAEPDIKFLTQAVQPPSAVYVAPGDFLQVGAASNQAGESVIVTWRMLLPNRKIAYNQFVMQISSDRAINIHREQLPEGFLLSVSCKAAVANTRGQTFARVFITNPATGSGQPSFMLMSDYITTAMAPAHPNGRQLAPNEGPGQPLLVLIGNPAAGSEWSFTIPTNARVRLYGVFSVLSTSAAVANRVPYYRLSIAGGTIIFQGGALVAQTASLNVGYMGAQLPPASYADGGQMLSLAPNHLLLGSDKIGSFTTAIQAGDQWSSIGITGEWWLDNV